MSIVLNCLPCRCSHRKWERYRRSEVSTACHSICWIDTYHGTNRSRVRTAPISICPVCCTSKFYSRWQDITHGCDTSTCLWSDIGHNNLICQRSVRGRRYCGCWSLRIIGTNKFAYYEVKSRCWWYDHTCWIIVRTSCDWITIWWWRWWITGWIIGICTRWITCWSGWTIGSTDIDNIANLSCWRSIDRKCHWNGDRCRCTSGE